MKIEYRLPFRRTPIHERLAPEPPPPPERHPPRIARLMALAHKLDGLVQSGVVRDTALWLVWGTSLRRA